MKVEVDINSNTKEPKVVIYTNEITEEIFKLTRELTEYCTSNIVGFLDNEIFILDKKEIETFYTEENKVYARTVNQKSMLLNIVCMN